MGKIILFIFIMLCSWCASLGAADLKSLTMLANTMQTLEELPNAIVKKVKRIMIDDDFDEKLFIYCESPKSVALLIKQLFPRYAANPQEGIVFYNKKAREASPNQKYKLLHALKGFLIVLKDLFLSKEDEYLKKYGNKRISLICDFIVFVYNLLAYPLLQESIDSTFLLHHGFLEKIDVQIWQLTREIIPNPLTTESIRNTKLLTKSIRIIHDNYAEQTFYEIIKDNKKSCIINLKHNPHSTKKCNPYYRFGLLSNPEIWWHLFALPEQEEKGYEEALKALPNKKAVLTITSFFQTKTD